MIINMMFLTFTCNFCKKNECDHKVWMQAGSGICTPYIFDICDKCWRKTVYETNHMKKERKIYLITEAESPIHKMSHIKCKCGDIVCPDYFNNYIKCDNKHHSSTSHKLHRFRAVAQCGICTSEPINLCCECYSEYKFNLSLCRMFKKLPTAMIIAITSFSNSVKVDSIVSCDCQTNPICSIVSLFNK
ncbi:MAG: hypothetical protein Edafosvirus1_137 [Edafosvirus sp.]|uniref:Uncharacterized protein n=1 Tax=Edafosvirus sp. TaxID=2487765 RepID=A0A3G4ZSD1_9VIRU|nr:MAG: hypothetical protein Edafosvirus1_137 [Edafosvirus sp.]